MIISISTSTYFSFLWPIYEFGTLNFSFRSEASVGPLFSIRHIGKTWRDSALGEEMKLILFYGRPIYDVIIQNSNPPELLFRKYFIQIFFTTLSTCLTLTVISNLKKLTTLIRDPVYRRGSATAEKYWWHCKGGTKSTGGTSYFATSVSKLW